MPQMMPMNWIILMLYFTILTYIFISMTFFLSLNNKPLTPQKNASQLKTLNWKW
uniref:ATP synthase F0 subunit 8 n=1 Tax=Stenopsyche angustata TaxID=1560148 RepID=A0A7L8XF18_9NEOP|nr:ATP synthase F0 subunit 8 [Stenopsyche angustata]QOH91242.1 ATP synthase F0 subunit 8 [Stenopsyche angustata]